MSSRVPAVSCHLTFRERRVVLMGVVSVLKHLVAGGVLVALDFLVFWILDQVHHQVKGDVVARGETTALLYVSVCACGNHGNAPSPSAPVLVTVQVEGGGYASDIFRDMVAAFNILQRGNLTVISRRCQVEPSEPDYVTCFTLGEVTQLQRPHRPPCEHQPSITSFSHVRCRKVYNVLMEEDRKPNRKLLQAL